MSRFRLHRSLLFWAGVMVMGFIGWGWWHSTRVLSSGYYNGWVVMNSNSRVSCGHLSVSQKGWHPFVTDPGELGFSPWRFGFPRLVRHAGGGRGWDDPVSFSGEDDSIHQVDLMYLAWGKEDDWQFFLPHWLLLAGFAVPWVGALLWLAWKRRRAAAVTVDGEREAA